MICYIIIIKETVEIGDDVMRNDDEFNIYQNIKNDAAFWNFRTTRILFPYYNMGSSVTKNSVRIHEKY